MLSTPSSTSSPTSDAADAADAADARLTPQRLWACAGVEALLAFVLAMIRIDARSLWYDEGVSVVISDGSPREITHLARTFEPNMSAYHAVLHFWREIFGSSETALRSLSAVSVALAVPVLVALTHRLRDARTALVAGLVLAVAPIVIRYGQEARSYGLEVLVVTGMAYCFVRLVDPADAAAARHAWPVAAYGAMAAFSIYLHLFAVFVVVAHALSLTFLPRDRVPWCRLGAAGALLVALSVPMLLWLAGSPSQDIDWISTPTPHDVYGAAAILAGGGLVKVVLAALVVIAIVAFGRVFAYTHRGRDVWSHGLALLWLTVPFVMSLAISWTVMPIFFHRYVIVSVPALALVVASAITGLKSRALAIVALALVVVTSLVSVVDQYGGQQEDWRAVTDFLATHSDRVDGVVVCPPRRRAPLQYYVGRTVAPDDRPRLLSPVGRWGGGLRTRRASARAIEAWETGGPERIWVATSGHQCPFDFDGRTRAVQRDVAGVRLERYDRE